VLAQARSRIMRYTRSLAAASLVELGVDAGDLIGGYEAW
jgi:rhodanese-related sulfurtransferase